MQSQGRFYDTLDDFVENSNVSRGEFPEFYYVVDLDYSNTDKDEEPPKEISSLLTLSKLIKYLSKLAHYHDQKSSLKYIKLVFVQQNDPDKLPPVEIETRIKKYLLKYPPPDINLIEGLSSEDAKKSPHYNARLGVFSISIVEFIRKKQVGIPAFSFLVNKWDSFIELYNNNLNTYISGFAFHKAKQDVANAELSISEQYSKVISDIAGKLFGIPISFAAVITIGQSDSAFSSTFMVLGLLVAAAVIAGIVDNQQLQFGRVCHAKDIVLNALEGKKEIFPESLREKIIEMQTALDKNSSKLGVMLNVFRCLAWLPVVIGTIIHVSLYSEWF